MMILVVLHGSRNLFDVYVTKFDVKIIIGIMFEFISNKTLAIFEKQMAVYKVHMETLGTRVHHNCQL